MLDRWAERKVVTFPKVPFPMTAKKSKSVGRALEREKTANHPINLPMLNQNTPVHCNPLENLLNLSTFQLQNLILINIYRNSGKINWLWVCWRSQVDVIVGGRLWPLLEDKQVWGKPKTFSLRDFGSPTHESSTSLTCKAVRVLKNWGQNYAIQGIKTLIPH